MTPSSRPRVSPPAVFASCPPPPPRTAAALAYDLSGRQMWRVQLPTDDATAMTGPAPVVVGDVELVPVDGVLHALSVADGRQRWSYPYRGDAYGLWFTGGTVALLVDQVGPNARLIGLDPLTGTVRYTLPVGGTGLYADQVATGDGGLAWIREDGSLQVVDLAAGRLRWSHPLGLSAALGAAGGTVLYGAQGHVHAYDSLTGASRWTVEAGAGSPRLDVVGKLAILSPTSSGAGISTTVAAVDLTEGRLSWTFDRQQTLTVVGSSDTDVLLASYVPDRRLYDLDPSTGRVRWSVTTFVAQDTSLLISGTDVVGIEGGGVDYPTLRLVDRSAATGAVRWQHDLAAGPASRRPLDLIGGNVLVQTEGLQATDPAPATVFRLGDGQQLWRADVPGIVQIPDLVAADRLLVTTEDPQTACPA